MVERAALSAVLGFCVLAAPALSAPSGKAPCGSFQKLPDGKWSVIKLLKIEHGNASALLNPGTIISTGMQVAGIDIYAALQKNCQPSQGQRGECCASGPPSIMQCASGTAYQSCG